MDSSHAADLTFRYSVRNAGTEYARELSNLIFNIYIGDDKLPTISYKAWEQFANGKLDNLFPVGPNTPPGVVSTRTFASNAIPLSLEQMKRIDLGERLTVKVESFSFGADELFYTDAINGGVTVYIEDGVEDGDETVDQYVIPTWGTESVQDVLTRYFPHAEDADGNLNSLWTPEFNGVNAPTWHEYYLSDIAWWNVYLTQADEGDTPLHQLPAKAGSGILFRFNRDSDRDGYNDRAEFRYYCALPAGHVDRPRCADGHLRPEIHPQPKVMAGYVVERSGNVATVKLALENTGTFDAYGIDAVMYSPDATTTIGNNTVGGNGKVRPGNKVTVGSMVKAPDLSNWGASRARPYAAGEYSGATDRTFTFTAQTPGVVGTGSTAVAWNDGAGSSGVLQLGGSYHAPLPVDVAHGVQVGFNTGTIDAGARFTVQALTSRDTFTYTINSEPFTPPVIVVSYSDPQGSHRFVTPVQLPALGASLAPHVNAMLERIELKIVATAPFVANGANTTNLVVNNPHPATIRDGHLHLNFVSDGKLVLEKSYTLDIPAGPTTFAANWSVTEFSADYNPNGDNLLIAFWTDSENNIIDSAARPLNSFAADPKPAAASDAAAWDFGSVTQGEVLQRTVSLASVGDMDLLGYVHGAPGLSVSQTGSKPLGIGDVATYQLTLDTRTLPTGPYSGTVTLRTSDPAHPLYTVQVSGEIQAASGDAYARTVTDRPLDVEVWVPGNRAQGEWITFEHPLGPEPQSLHPVKVYSQDGATLYGVGKYATDFSAGAASAAMFGTGRDGPLNVTTNPTIVNIYAPLHVSVSAGATSLAVGWNPGFQQGDEILIHQTQGTGAGAWEVNTIANQPATVLNLQRPLANGYAQGGNSHTQIIRIPHYTNVTVQNGGVLTAPAWDGVLGGILIFRANGAITVQSSGTINVSGKGFRGGTYKAGRGGRNGQGEGFPAGPNGSSASANGNGGGGGRQESGDRAFDYGGGGGGGNGTSGGNAQNQGAVGGTTIGTSNLSSFTLGGGGGVGGGPWDGLDQAGNGGVGGGAILVFGDTIQMVGSILTDGLNGGNRAGGGGAGGSILISGRNVSLSNQVGARGGYGEATHDRVGAGGNGGAGRIYVQYCDSLIGGTNPAATTQRIDCYVAEQIESAPYTTARLNLPENVTGGNIYRMQYARRLTLASAGEMATTLGVPAGIWTAASLDALISGVGSGDVTFKLDVGADGVWDWEETRSVTNAAPFSSPDLAAAFAPYVNGAGQVDVPVKVYLSKPGQVLLTNMAVTRNQAVELASAFTLSGSPTEGAVVPLNATVANSGAADSGPLTVSYYATRPSPLAPQYIGSVFVPNVPQAGTVAAPFQWNTLGFTGPITVTAVVDPYNRIAENTKTNNSTATPITILTRPDLAFTNVTLSNPEPTAGETVTLTVNLKNHGQTATGAHRLALYRDNPDGGGTQIRVQSVSTLNGGASRAIAVPWTPTTPGLHRLFLRVDRDGQVNEFNEGNNDRWLDVYVGFASPLAVDSGGAGDAAYSPFNGQGAVDTGLPDEAGNCGDAPYQSYRRDPSGRVTYRFDHLLPGHFYHLDLVLYECGQNAGRQQRVWVDGMEIAGPIDLGSGEVQNLSLLLDPALYADRTISVTVSVDGSGGALVNQIALVDVDYRYADAGGARDVQYPSGRRPYGWLDGVRQIPWGTLPFQSLRENQSGNEMRYRFDALDPNKSYQVHFNFFLGGGNNRVQQIWVDDVIPLSGDFTLIAGQRNSQRVDLPKESYADGTITIAVRRSDGATTGAMINEIALEEMTQARASTCQVAATPSWTVAFGNVSVAGQPAAPGTVVTAQNPRGDVVGCYVVNNTGQYGFMSVFGEDASGGSLIPGMKAGEPVIFRVNGVIAVPTPLLTWQDNKTRTRINLEAGITISQYLLLRPNWNLLSTRMTPPVPLLSIVFQSIAEKYCQVLGPRGIYDCTVPASFQSLKEIAPGKAYYTKINGGASVNMVIEGVPLSADTPIPLERGLNWVGYLPSVKLPIATALSSISAQLVQVADGQGQIYDPAEPDFNNLLEMMPGHGYLIHLSDAATLVYPSTGAALADTPAAAEEMTGTGSVHCGGVEPTPYFTTIYGRIAINGADAAVGDRVEILTPRGEVAGCFTVTKLGQYGFLSVFGADSAAGGLPGFLDAEAMTLRFNGTAVELSEPLIWRDDKSTRRVDLDIIAAEPAKLYLPITTR
ncbi:MAG: hypothetical protein KF893_09700 [Caldilineaceae bacterium]|nr:hypothetical protein [Caldilineaceae bacterium]